MKIHSLTIAALTAKISAEDSPIDRAIDYGNLWEQSGLYLRQYAPGLITEFIGDSNVADDILKHGCFCAKLDSTNPFHEFLGGTTTVDGLDEICRDWLRARNCNDNLTGGSCEANRAAMRTGSYKIGIDTADVELSQCAFTDAGCPLDTCEIDLDHLIRLKEYMDDPNNVFQTFVNVETAGTCTPAPLDKRERKCLGTAPDVYPKRMSDLEQLFMRADWDESRSLDDELSYEDGGRKLNDDKEFILIDVDDQLITFAWDNVKSITFETNEDFNAYYVGWVEKSSMYNFSGQDTLGDFSKGGAQTIGMFSGDATLRANGGFELAADNPTDFFETGDTVTLEHDKDANEFKFSVNGVLQRTMPSNAWASAYPAIDTKERFEVKITNVVFDE